MSVQSLLRAWPRKSRMIGTATLLLVPILLSSGCGTGAGNPATTPPGGNGQQAANLSTDNNLGTGSGGNRPGNSATNAMPTPGVNNSETQTNQTVGTVAGAPLQLENIQIGDKSVLFSTTHGNMRQAFVDPHIENGNPNRFVVTLAQVNPGKYAVNKTIHLQTHWATAMTIVQQGQDLEVQFDLLPNIQRFTSAMGAGQMVLYTFQSS